MTTVIFREAVFMIRNPRGFSFVPIVFAVFLAFSARETRERSPQGRGGPIVPPVITAPPGSAAVEQAAPGAKPPAALVASFDGMGAGFTGPQGSATANNPSDNSLAVGPNHIVQTVNSRMAIFTKKGKQFPETGKALYGPVPTNNVF